MGDDNPSPIPLSCPEGEFENFFSGQVTVVNTLGKRGAVNFNGHPPSKTSVSEVNRISGKAGTTGGLERERIGECEMSPSGDNINNDLISETNVPQNNLSGDNTVPVRLSLSYPLEHPGDYLVLVDSSGADPENQKVRNAMFLYGKIRHLGIKGIMFIKEIGRTLFRIKFDSALNANTFASMKLDHLGLRPFIPESFVYSYGVIRGIPLELDDEYIKCNTTSDIPIVSARRFIRKNTASGSEEPTFLVKLAFFSSDIPEYIILEYCHVQVSRYFPPVRQCLNCGRLGHTKKGCRSKARCLRCTKSDCTGDCEVRCILCGDISHVGTDKKSCPKWQEENDVLKIMTIKKLSRREVLNSYSTNRFDIFDDYDGNFPEFGSQKPAPVKDRNAEVNKILTRRKYSKVVTRKPPPPRPKPNFFVPQPIDTNPTTPVIYRGNERVSDFERILSEFTSFIRSHFAKEGNGSALRVLDSFSTQLVNSFSDISRFGAASAVDP